MPARRARVAREEGPDAAMTAKVRYTVEPVGAQHWEALVALFGNAGASNGCWCQYWILGPAYHRHDRALNRTALRSECVKGTQPAPGLIAMSPDHQAQGWARLVPRGQLPWLEARFSTGSATGGDVWAMPCFFIRRTARGTGVMSSLIEAGVSEAMRMGATVEAYPIDPEVPGATRNRFTGVLQPFLRAGFVEVDRLSSGRCIVRHVP